jgi:hypothetical protein
MIFANSEQAQQACQKLQAIMGLSDWDVKVYVGLVPERGSQASVQYSAERREAYITLMNPAYWDPGCQWEQNHLRSLVHELTHLMLAGMDAFAPKDPVALTAWNVMQEQIINAFSKAFWEWTRTPVVQ